MDLTQLVTISTLTLDFNITKMRLQSFTLLYIALTLAAAETSLPEEKANRTNCNNGVLGTKLSPFCLDDKIVAVNNLKYACTATSNCSEDTVLTRTVPSSTLSVAVTQVSGEQYRSYTVAKSVCSNKATLMRMSYYCIKKSSILQMCSAKSLTLTGVVYVVSSNYPRVFPVTQPTECICSVTSDKSSTSNTFIPFKTATHLTMVTLHTDLNAGQQLTVMSQNGSVLKTSTKDNAEYGVSLMQSVYSKLNVRWRAVDLRANGLFWIGFKNSDPASTVTVTCQKPMHISTTPTTTASKTSTQHSSSSPFRPSSSQRNSGKTRQAPRSESNANNVILIILGVVCGVLLLIIIIIVIICIVQKSEERKTVPDKTKDFGQHNTSGKQAEKTKESHRMTQVPKLPPLGLAGSNFGSGGQHAENPRNMRFKGDFKKMDLDDSGVSETESKRERQKRKKKKQWTEKVPGYDDII